MAELYEGPERRIDPENKLSLVVHAGRALNRFRGPDAENIDTAAFREGEPMRIEVRRLLDQIEGKLTPEQRLQKLVARQYGSELEMLREYGLYNADCPNEGDVPAPNVEIAFEALFTKLTSEQIAEIFRQAKQPQFQMEAITSFERYVTALDAHKKMLGQNDTYVNANRSAAWAAQDSVGGIGDNIVGWNVGIIDAAQELEADPELNGNLGQKLAQAEAKLKPVGLRLPHPRRYALAQMRALQQKGKPLDVDNWSVLNDDTGHHSSVVPCGTWNTGQVCFSEGDPDHQYDYVRFRPEVVVRAA